MSTTHAPAGWARRGRLVALGLLAIVCGHLLIMASPWHGSAPHQAGHAGGHRADSALVRMASPASAGILVAAVAAADCAIQGVLAPRWTMVGSSLLLMWLWPFLDRNLTSVTRAVDSTPPPRSGDRQALLQVFRL